MDGIRALQSRPAAWKIGVSPDPSHFPTKRNLPNTDRKRDRTRQANCNIAGLTLLTFTTSAFLSSFWILGGVFEGKFKARSRFVRAIGKLGLSYWHIQRATAAQGQTGSFQQNPILREEVLKWRDKV